MNDETKSRLKEYLLKNNWSVQFEYKETETFFKNRFQEPTNEIEFLNYSRRKKPIELNEFLSRFYKFFKGKGHLPVFAEDVINRRDKDTMFIVAGIQHFADYLHGNASLETGNHVIAQPSIRQKFRESVGEGNVSSFVNIASSECDTNISRYITQIDNWMEFLSSLGLYLGDFRLELKDISRKKGFWSNAQGAVLKFFYGGLELGDAGLLMFNNKPKKFISDIGFGLERLLWSINKTPHFSDILGPFPISFSNNYRLIDGVRTSTLMAMSSLSNQDIDQFRQFRIYLDNPDILHEPNLEEMINHYYQFWSKFVPNPKNIDETKNLLKGELNRKRNLRLLQQIGISATLSKFGRSLTLNQDEFIRYLVQSNICSLDLIREQIQERDQF